MANLEKLWPKSKGHIYQPCAYCPSRNLCKTHGCRAWNPEARKAIEKIERSWYRPHPTTPERTEE